MQKCEWPELALKMLGFEKDRDNERSRNVVAKILQSLNDHDCTYQFYDDGIPYADRNGILSTIIVVVYRNDGNICALVHVIPPRFGSLKNVTDVNPLAVVVHAFQVDNQYGHAVVEALKHVKWEFDIEYVSWDRPQTGNEPLTANSCRLKQLLLSIRPH